MKIVLVILACLLSLLSHKVLLQQLPGLYNSDCIVHLNSEDTCYPTSEVICENGTCRLPIATNVVPPTFKMGKYTFVTSGDILSSGPPNAKVYKLCREEALQLTLHDLDCGESCMTKSFTEGLNGFEIDCSQFDYNIFKDNWLLLLFRPDSRNSSCESSLSPYFVLIDTSDMNECNDSKTYNCSNNAECVDQQCGYSCHCLPGYHMSDDNYTCLTSLKFEEPSYTFSESKQGNTPARICATILPNLPSISGSVTVTLIPNTTQEGEDYMFHGRRNFTLTQSAKLCVNITIINDQLPEGSETMSLHVALQRSGHDVVLQQMTNITIVDDFGFAMVPMSISAVLNTENVSFTCGKEASFAGYTIEWNAKYQENTKAIIVGKDKSQDTFSLPPTLLYRDTVVTCKLISDSSMPSSKSDPAHLTLQYATIALNRNSYTVNESVTNLNVYVQVVSSSLPNVENHEAIITISTASESAKANMDFYPLPNNVNVTLTSLSPGYRSLSLNVKIIDDSSVEQNEIFLIVLTSSSPGVLIEVSNVTVTIIDNDVVETEGCPSEKDVRNILWNNAPRNSTHVQPCPGNTAGARATRTCNTMGKWENTNFTECISVRISDLEKQAECLASVDPDGRAMKLNDIIKELIMLTEPKDHLLLPLFLQSIVRTLTYIIDTLVNDTTNSEKVIDIFNNLLDESKEGIWRSLQNDGQTISSEILLDNAERYAMILANSMKHKTSMTLSKSNIVVKVHQYKEIPSNGIFFPVRDDLVNYINNKHTSNIKIPSSLIRESINHGETLPVSFILFRYLPLNNFAPNDSTVATSGVISAQLGMARESIRSSVLRDDPVILNFGFETLGTKSSHSCVYWNFSQPIGSGGWTSNGVTTACVTTSENITMVMCTSTHLTPFAVLVDTTGELEKLADDVKLALEVVSYIGCVVSIVCLIATVVFFLCQGRNLFVKAHNFVHLNLALSLLLANLVFVSGIDTANGNEAACAFVAALLHYLFLSAFGWMLCEGIVLYLLLVVVFGNMARKLWLFIIIGYLLPLPIVIVTVGVRYQYYGVKDDCGRLLHCWLSTKEGTIYGFVGPVVVVILVNVLFLLITLRVLYKTKKQRLQRSKENSKSVMKTTKTLLVASFVLLPLLGLTWAFGIFNVNENTIVFAWLFTMFNSLQGTFIFFFHVIRSQVVRKKLGSRLHSMMGTVRSRYTTTSKWSHSDNSLTTTEKGKPGLEDDVTTTSESVCTPKPTVEVVKAHGNTPTEQPTTQKLTVLRINQLVHKAEKLLATHQDLPTAIMETNMHSAGQGNATNEKNPTGIL